MQSVSGQKVHALLPSIHPPKTVSSSLGTAHYKAWGEWGGGGRGVGVKQSVNLELCLPPDPWPPTEPQATNEKQTHKAPIFQFTG